MSFGFHIKKLREKAGITSAEMAAIIGVDNVERYRNWEKRDALPKAKDLNKIEQIFGIRLDDILLLSELPTNILNKNGQEEMLIIAPKGRLNKQNGTGLVKFYDTDFSAGDIQFFEDNNTINPAYEMDIPEFAGCTAFRSYGDSMEPMIKSGSILFGTLVNDWQSHLEYGQIYGIVCNDKRKYLKYIRKDKDRHVSHYLLRSENKEYDDFDLPKEKIKAIWLIHGWINKRT